MYNHKQHLQFLRNLSRMREMQQEYFDTRSKTSLSEAKRYESIIDRNLPKAINFIKNIAAQEEE